MFYAARCILKRARVPKLTFIWRPVSQDSRTSSIINYVEKCLAQKSPSFGFVKLAQIQASFRELKKCLEDQAEVGSLLTDPTVDVDMKELARADLTQLQQDESRLCSQLGGLLIPEERYDKENALLEVFFA